MPSQCVSSKPKFAGIKLTTRCSFLNEKIEVVDTKWGKLLVVALNG
jgi:hypothetical protein